MHASFELEYQQCVDKNPTKKMPEKSRLKSVGAPKDFFDSVVSDFPPPDLLESRRIKQRRLHQRRLKTSKELRAKVPICEPLIIPPRRPVHSCLLWKLPLEPQYPCAEFIEDLIRPPNNNFFLKIRCRCKECESSADRRWDMQNGMKCLNTISGKCPSRRIQRRIKKKNIGHIPLPLKNVFSAQELRQYLINQKTSIALGCHLIGSSDWRSEVVIIITSLRTSRIAFNDSLRAIHLLTCKGIEFFIADVNGDVGSDVLDLALVSRWRHLHWICRDPEKRITKTKKDVVTPQILIDGVPIGGYCELQMLEEDGDLGSFKWSMFNCCFVDYIMAEEACPNCLVNRVAMCGKPPPLNIDGTRAPLDSPILQNNFCYSCGAVFRKLVNKEILPGSFLPTFCKKSFIFNDHKEIASFAKTKDFMNRRLPMQMIDEELILSGVFSRQVFNVSFELESTWPKVPSLLEAIEFISDVNENDITPALRTIAESLVHSENEIDEEKTDAVLERLNSSLFSSPYTGPLMSLFISNHYFSARVEFLRTLERQIRISTDNCGEDTWAVACFPEDFGYRSFPACKASALNLTLNNHNKVRVTRRSEKWSSVSYDYQPCSVLKFDHFIGHKRIKIAKNETTHSSLFYPNFPHIFIFSSLSTKSSGASLIEFLNVIEEHENIAAIFRPSDRPECRLVHGTSEHEVDSNSTAQLDLARLCQRNSACCPDNLFGYGAELAVKNPEYKTVDDIEENQDVKGTLMKSVSSVIPEDESEPVEDPSPSAPQLNENPDRLLQEKELKLLGLQAVAALKKETRSSDHETFKVWLDLVSNFPSKVTKLVNIKVPRQFISDVKHLQARVYERSNVVTLNSGLVDSSGQTVCFLSLLRQIGTHLVAIELFTREGLHVTDAISLIQTDFIVNTPSKEHEETNAFRFNALPARLDWRINVNETSTDERRVPLIPIFDVTQDLSTIDWPEDVDKFSLLMMMRGMLLVRAPLYHVIVLFDPLVPERVGQALEFLAMKIPMKLYFIPYVSHCIKSQKVQSWNSLKWGTPPDDLKMEEHQFNEHCLSWATIVDAFYQLLENETLELSEQKKAVNFLRELKKALESNTKNSKKDIIAKTKAKFGIVTQITSKYVKSLIAYVDRKGLPTNTILLNGKVLSLQSLMKNLEIHKKYISDRPLRALDIFNIYILQEQQTIATGVLYGSFDLADDPASFLLSQNSVPTCLIPWEQSMEDSEIPPSVCEMLRWDMNVPAQSTASIFEDYSDQSNRMLQPDSISLLTRHHPLFSTNDLAGIPEISFGLTRNCLPVDWIFYSHSDLNGLKILNSLLLHLQANLQNQPSAMPLCTTLRLVDAGPSKQNNILDILSAFLSMALGEEENTVSPFFSIQVAIDISVEIVQSCIAILQSNSTFPTINYSIKKVLETTLSNTDVDVGHIWKAIAKATPLNRATAKTEFIRQMEDFSGWENATIVVCNNRINRIDLKIFNEVNGQQYFKMLQMLSLKDNFDDIFWSDMLSKERLPIAEWSLKEEMDKGSTTKFLWESLFSNRSNLKKRDFLKVLAIRRRALSTADNWDMPRQIYNESRSSLRLSLGSISSVIPSPLKIYAIIDPLSRLSQSLLPILEVCNHVLNIEVNLVMNPAMALKEYPLARWYRQAIKLPTCLKLKSSRTSSTYQTSKVEFENLLTEHTLTTGLHVPDAWLVTASSTALDLDNLRQRGNSDQLFEATFQLSDIFVEGQALPSSLGLRGDSMSFDMLAGTKLSLHLDEAAASSHQLCDTIVMRNLAYFQLRARPGLFWIRTNGHTQINDRQLLIDSLDGLTSRYSGDKTRMPIVVNSLLSFPHNLHISKSPIRTLDQFPKQHIYYIQYLIKLWRKGIYEYVYPWHHKSQKCAESIHVFSLASGHMYERLLRIMILSVVKHTTCPVEFWFIDNFLSPQFKRVMPLMSHKYNIKFHYVTYKWPSWLRRQTEKQRQIWAYKILFLDVMFPNDVARIIYIDADQVVRSNIYELWKMNLEGKPYAFTPFCNSNRETEGLRFWKTGYWKDHLHGKPYHISALFVVDLKKFREIGAGDSLRAIYTTLSKDKNSLANLDQDLPNYAQHEIPIFSLPQEWLWCETWCSRESLIAAKTVDLCNNPLTKEPKLSQAKRILPEWSFYNEEILQLENIRNENQSEILADRQQVKDEL